MKEYTIDEYTLGMMIQSLKESIQVSYDAPKNADEGYPYATGYSRSCMMSTLDTLERIKN